MNMQLSKLALAILLPAIIVVGYNGTPAQTRSGTGKSKAVKKLPQRQVSRPGAEKAAKPILSPREAPVSIVNLAEPDYLSGDASVTVNPKQPTVIRLGLAQNAVSIVEFPASDGIYYIHEGNPKLASVFQSPTKETDRSITIYPGESFVPSRDGNASTAISLQMRSGLVLILELVPVADLKRNAHRCVITYDRDAVISARRTAGLAYDLGRDSGLSGPTNSRAVSKLIGEASPAKPVNSPQTPQDEDHTLSSAYANLGASRNSRGKGSDKKKTDNEISALANKKLAESLREPNKNLGTWSKAQHGLEIAVSRITELDSETRLVVVAIRNLTPSNLRLVPGAPELQVQTTDTSGNSIQTTRIEARYVESTTLEGLVQSGSTAYYVLVYKAPILGTNQSVRVLVAHREAADAPITSSLGDSK